MLLFAFYIIWGIDMNEEGIFNMEYKLNN